MEIFVTVAISIIGALVVVALSLTAISYAVIAIVSAIKNREWHEQEHVIRANLSELKRWCGYEFPLVERTCDEIKKCLDEKRFVNADYFREKLRKEKDPQ